MKKFTLLAIAALVSVVAFAQKDVKRASETMRQIVFERQLTPKSAQQLPAQLFEQQAVAKKNFRKAPRKAIASADELLGDVLVCSYNFDYDDVAEELVPAKVASFGQPAEIVKQTDGSLGIQHFFDAEAEEIVTINVDLAEGTFTIPAGQVVYSKSPYTDCTLKSSTSQGDLSGFILDDGSLYISDIWYVEIGSGQYAGYMLSNYESSLIAKPNGIMSWVNSKDEDTEVGVYLMQDEDDHVVTVFNFADWGAGVEIELKDEQKFAIEPQVIYSSSQDGDYTTVTAIAGTNYIGSDVITGSGTANSLTSDTNFTAYNGLDSWFGNQGAFTITTDALEFIYPVIENVAAMPANPEVISLTEYDAERGYGAVIVDVPLKDVDGNDLKEGLLYYQIYSDIDGTIAPIVYTADLYEYLDEDLTVIPYTYTDNYDFDIYDGYKRVFLNWDYSNFTRIGVKSIYKGGNAVNETEIQWLDIAAFREQVAVEEAKDDLLDELLVAIELMQTEGFEEGVDEFEAAITAAKNVYLDEDATLAEVEAAIVALQKAEEDFRFANMTEDERMAGEATWIAKNQGYANAEELGEFKIDDFLTGEFAAGTYESSSKYYTSNGPVRFYAGNTLTISGNDGIKKITKIQFTFSSKTYAKTFTVDNGTYAKEDKYGLWTGESKEVTFTNAESGQARIAQIDVFYVKSETAVGIENVETAQKTVGGIYNLQGQRMTQMPQKGLYIMDGKKVVIK